MSESPLLLLASTSSSRRKILDDTGFGYTTLSPLVDERATVSEEREAGRELSPRAEAQLLAEAKANAAAARPEAAGRLVLGCDSVFEFDGVAYGKPLDDADAASRWKAMRGGVGVLHTGHTLVDTRATPFSSASETVSTRVYFAQISDQEVEAYVATGEPLPCAGAFTVDGRAAAFVTGLEGDFHAVVGLSVSALRTLAAQVEVPVTALWAPSGA